MHLRHLRIGLNFRALHIFLIYKFICLTSCSPIKFNRESTFVINASCYGTSCLASAIKCDPKIKIKASNQASNQQGSESISYASSFTYNYSPLTASENIPSIDSNCLGSDIEYTWIVKKADGYIIETPILGLSGENPSYVDFQSLGQGIYYVFLKASKVIGGYNSFDSISTQTTALEFVVPGPEVGSSLTCEPKIKKILKNSVSANENFESKNQEEEFDSDSFLITANCTPDAGNYYWTAVKEDSPITISGLSGASSEPNIKSYGSGNYKIYLYATATNSTHWQSSKPLEVKIDESTLSENPVECNPRINGSLESLTLTSSSEVPLITGNCQPSNVSYSWTVIKNSKEVTSLNLSGAHLNPDFSLLEAGTYLIYLSSKLSNSNSNSNLILNSWQSKIPLTITVAETDIKNKTLNCAPRINQTQLSLMVSTNEINPKLTSGCAVETALHNWSVYKNGVPIAIKGLNGSSSTGDFVGAGEGTYFIYLTASALGYNSYSGVTPLVINVISDHEIQRPQMVNGANSEREVAFEKFIQSSDDKVDILIVLADSQSTELENSKMAQQLHKFGSELTASGMDWQMCMTVMKSQKINKNGSYFWGASRNWIGYPYAESWILKRDTLASSFNFAKSMESLFKASATTSNNEEKRGLKAAWWNISYNKFNNCYRKDASLAVILASDRDSSAGLKTLDADDQPKEFVNKIKQEFGINKRFTFNSIIAKPGDATCKEVQKDMDYGYKYKELSDLTGGFVGSICDSDYSENFKYIKNRILKTQFTVPLECAPVGPVIAKITPTIAGQVPMEVHNNHLILNSPIAEGRRLNVFYKCSGG